jgi:hypothetical protein
MARLTCLTPRAVLRSAFFIDGCHSGIVSFEFDLEHTGSWAHPMTVPLRTGH